MSKSKMGTRISILVLGLLSLLGVCGFIYFIVLHGYSMSIGPRWDLSTLQRDFIGELPSDAIDVSFITKSPDVYANYALLSFKASPRSINSFVGKLCYGDAYQGYDPFNAIDAYDMSDREIMISITESSYYYSSSPNAAQTTFGNRCDDPKSGNVQQFVVDKTNANFYSIKLEMATRCADLSNKPLCEGNFVNYVTQSKLVEGVPQVIEGQSGKGNRWLVDLVPNADYVIKIKLADANIENETTQFKLVVRPLGKLLSTNSRTYDSLTATPTLEVYCDECWRFMRHKILDESAGLKFKAASTGQAIIEFFLIGEQATYSIELSKTV